MENRQVLVQYDINIDQVPELQGVYGDGYAEKLGGVARSSLALLLNAVAKRIEADKLQLPSEMTLSMEWLERDFSGKFIITLEKRND